MTIQPEIIRSKLVQLRTSDVQLSLFGAKTHRYKLRPAATIDDVCQFEQQHKVRLPEDYRRFLLEVGNGGAGPCHGILGLDQLPEVNEDCWGAPSKPFPHQVGTRGNTALVSEMASLGDDDDERYNHLSAKYWEEMLADGAISICEYGCALRYLLVVNGSQYGKIWFDASADFEGLRPVSLLPNPSTTRNGSWCEEYQESEQRVSFGQWYHHWLTWALRVVELDTGQSQFD